MRDVTGLKVAASDYLKALPSAIEQWVPGGLTCLGTDGFGRSESRAVLRDFFEVDERHITVATLSALVRTGELSPDVVKRAITELSIDPDRPNPVTR